MRSPRAALVPLALLLLGPGLLAAQEQPLAAGTDDVPVPKKKKHVQPVYPREALAQGIRGIVILDLVIDTEGKVADTIIVRSIPGLDEAALAAARQWQYEPVKVDGQLVSVRLTVPITFALKLPEMTRDRGIPELRQGVTPPWPATGGGGGGSAMADVTLDPDGRIGLANIIEGDDPWSTSLLQALRTWRFRAPREDASVSFRVEAEFVPGSGREQGSVRLRLSGLRESQFFDAPADELAPVAAFEPPLEAADASSERSEAPEAAEAMPDEPTPATAPETTTRAAEARPEPPAPPAPPAPQPVPEAPTPGAVLDAPARVAEATPEASAPPAPEPAPETPAPGAEAQPLPPPPATAGPEPATPIPGAPPAAPAPGAATPPPGPATAAPPPPAGAGAGTDPTAPPPVEVITAAPPPLPPENGVSAIRGVQLEPGVPDLTRGRRPVSPPFARMAGVGGVVEVEFSVGGGGITAVQRASGPEILQTAATQAVESWIFRRTRADRAYLTAVFTYEDDLASAIVRPQPAP
jgi:TonB family protein